MILPYFNMNNEMIPTISIIDRHLRNLSGYYGSEDVILTVKGSRHHEELTRHIDNLSLTYGMEIIKEYVEVVHEAA